MLFDGTITRSADGGHREASLAGSDIVDAVAYQLGSNFTVYLADHAIDRSAFEAFDRGEFSTESALTAAADGVLATVFLYGDDVSAGASLDVVDTASGVIVDAGGGAGANTLGAQGTITIIDVTEERICFTIDYRDEFQQMSGTVSAPVWQGS